MSLTCDFLEQISMMQILPQQGIESLDVYLPFLPVATMERVSEYGVNCLATADTLSRILSTNVPATKNGRTKLHIYDIHTLQNRFYFERDIELVPRTGLNLLRKKLTNEVIVFPDDGAAKRFKAFFENDFICLVCSKKREGDKRIISIEDNFFPSNMSYQSAIIIDDLAQSGKTLEECRKALIKKGFVNVSAYVTHVVFPNNSYFKMTKFYKFYFTNSNPTVASKLTFAPFEQLNLEEDICNSIRTDYKKEVNIYVSSLSEVKLKAVYLAFSTKFNCNVYGVETNSGVSEQPVGKETTTGCSNRMQELESKVKDYDFLVSIESGIDKREYCYDFSQCLIKTKDFSMGSVHSNFFVEIPEEYYEEAILENKTVGQLLYEKYGYKKDNWQKHFCGKDRVELIRDQLTYMIDENDF